MVLFTDRGSFAQNNGLQHQSAELKARSVQRCKNRYELKTVNVSERSAAASQIRTYQIRAQRGGCVEITVAGRDVFTLKILYVLRRLYLAKVN